MENGGASGKTIGVVIRTLNESELIGSCLETLQAQRGFFDLDVLVVDSGSTDTTVEIARAHGARIAELSPGDFDYSKALNVGIAEVRGELVISLSAHAIPVDDEWLRTITAPFDDPAVAGVSTRQVPWPHAPWQEVKRLSQAFGETRRSYSRESSDEILFSNAASAIRRTVWRDHPFTLPAVEDLDWAQRVVTAGWEVVYEPGTAVYHSHREGPRAQARRMIDINRVLNEGAAQRTRRRTLREAAGYLLRDAKWIFTLDEPFRRKLAYLAELIGTVWYYVVDFSREGTTAERRREDSRAARDASR
jgi:glycosyltransferase involved in cell wall biosynthesis